jgi:hypothetical protein
LKQVRRLQAPRVHSSPPFSFPLQP